MIVELSEQEREQVEQVEYWVRHWARKQRDSTGEIRALGMPAMASGTELARTNWAVTEEDMEHVYEVLLGRQIEMVAAAMEDLCSGPHWAWWAICKRHGLGHGGVWRYERLAPGGRIPPGLYTNALLELAPLLEKKGLVF